MNRMRKSRRTATGPVRLDGWQNDGFVIFSRFISDQNIQDTRSMGWAGHKVPQFRVHSTQLVYVKVVDVTTNDHTGFRVGC